MTARIEGISSGNMQSQIALRLTPPQTEAQRRFQPTSLLIAEAGGEPTMFRERLTLDMMTALSTKSKTYTADDLADISSNYPINLFVKTDKAQMMQSGIEVAHPQDINEVSSYLLPRLVSREHYELLNNADIHFTDNAKQFYADPNDKFIPSSRTRVYSVYKDQKTQRNQITFLLRHSIKDNYTDAQELISSISFIESIRKYAQHNDSDSNFLLHKSKHLQLGEKKIALSQPVQNLRSGTGMTLSKSELGLQPYWKAQKVGGSNEERKVAPVMQDIVQKIDVQLKKRGITPPKNVMYGNDFSVELLIGTGVVNDIGFSHIGAVAKSNNVELVDDGMVNTLKNDEDRKILRQYSAIQYLSRYDGNDAKMRQLRTDYQEALSSIKKTIISPTYTALGSVVNVIDFSNLEDSIIKRIDNKKIRSIVRGLRDTHYSYFALPYPLGDAVYGLTVALNKQFNITNFGFFGKVGVVPTPGSISDKGRVVIPETTAPSYLYEDSQVIPFHNNISAKDTVIIATADKHEGIVSVNALSLQTPDDLKRWKPPVKNVSGGGNWPNLLLDMEAHWFNLACRDLGITPSAIYYISDKTLEKYNPYDEIDSHAHTISKSLGAEGTLASLVTPYTILNKWLEMERTKKKLSGTIKVPRV